ncbi:hypothetical protein PM082_010156 [Marasmius tenuissimus]|nr:hypothetical protein PM082_010156 [Marasmius tenuissimus]
MNAGRKNRGGSAVEWGLGSDTSTRVTRLLSDVTVPLDDPGRLHIELGRIFEDHPVCGANTVRTYHEFHHTYRSISFPLDDLSPKYA